MSAMHYETLDCVFQTLQIGIFVLNLRTTMWGHAQQILICAHAMGIDNKQSNELGHRIIRAHAPNMLALSRVQNLFEVK